MNNKNIAGLAVPAGVVGVVMLLVVPTPAPMLDILITINIIGSLVILLTSMYVKRPLDFSIFPSLLLIATLFRLGLNVASTRLVLRDGYAGEVIGAFGHFVVGGSLVIGLVIFMILVVIQFVVITNGAGRVAEVGARFTLDAMPGKQMAIDADLNSGLTDEDTARRRRADVGAEADFYGAMDGGSKFVKGDAIAGIIIIIINLVGGFIIGMVQMGMSAGESLERFSLLTIGDGLVTQIPALLLSVSSGIIVTRSTADGDLGTVASKQLTQSSQALQIAGVAGIALALIPGLPKLPFMIIGALLIFFGQRVKARDAAEAITALIAAPPAPAQSPDSPEALIEQMRVHALEILLAPD
ncbi:MAG: FHIPEP family type III secretion protein, partial [Cellulomonas sp.]|nr:FHIPEP family type III secretion protein [Cellulomonas sp.]